MRDQFNEIKLVKGIAPVASAGDNTALASAIIDTAGFDSLTFALLFGAIPDADATFTTLVEHGDAANLSDAAAVADEDLLGTEVGAAPLFSDDGTQFKIGYKGTKRYVRVTVTPAANTGATLHAILAILGHPRTAPQSTQKT